MNKRVLKYIASLVAAILFFGMVFAFPLQAGSSSIHTPLLSAKQDTVPSAVADPVKFQQPEAPLQSETPPAAAEPIEVMPGRENPYRYIVPEDQRDDTVEIITADSTAVEQVFPGNVQPADTIYQDTVRADSVRTRNFLDDPISGTSTDSLVYRVKDKLVFIYGEGDVAYQRMNMKADYMRVAMDTKELYAHGISDSLGNQTRPEFIDGGAAYTMDTITYNIDTGKAKIQGVATQEGEGFLLGNTVKKHHDNSIHIKDGKYTTCDDPDCPHFYLALTKAKVIPNHKVITGFAYLVLEDVPLPLFIPEGFFPLSTGRTSGFIIPSYGEENIKGFFLRDGGYYFILSDHMDLTLLGGIYTKGSWEASASSRYTKRYKYAGNFSLRFSKDIIGEKNDTDYRNQNNFRIGWTHTQDPKFRPNSSFSASVNLSTSGYSKNSSQTIQDYLNTQTNSSISFSKSWPGTPFSFSTNIQHSQNSTDGTHTISFPNAVLNMSRIFPFKRKNAVGKQRWYEKISMSYTGNLSNSAKAKEEDLFSEEMFKNMNGSMRHNIPIATSFNLLNYINVTVGGTYAENWSFRKVEREWDPVARRQIDADTTYGFYRVFNYNANLSASTKIYGTWQFKSKTFPVQVIRHTITPTVGMSFAPDFGDPKYGFYKPIQADSTGRIDYYSPYQGAPGRGQSAQLNFSVGQTLEAKVLSKTDTSGMKKVKIIENFSFAGNYNFLKDSLKLSMISLNLRLTIPFLKNFGLNLSATLDPYEVIDVNGRATQINKFMLARGKIGRIASTSWQFGYTFNGGKQTGADAGRPAVNNLNSQMGINDPALNPYYFDPDSPIDPVLRREMMVGTYYDFSIPWNFGFNYSVSYRNDGLKKTVTQTMSFNGSVNLTPKWGLTFSGGFDFVKKELTPGVFTLTRDLHCWQFNFNWVPVGYRKSWSFNISVKSSMLKDLKYDRRNSHYDTLYDND